MNQLGSPPASVDPESTFTVNAKISNTGKRTGSTGLKAFLAAARDARRGIRVGFERARGIPARGMKDVGLDVRVPARGNGPDTVTAGEVGDRSGRPRQRPGERLRLLPRLRPWRDDGRGLPRDRRDLEVLRARGEAADRVRHGNIGTQEFIQVAKETSGFTGAKLELLDDYFQQWLYGETKPTIVPASFG